ncbi:MAG TPA: hypothetical protein PLD62_06560, partial [Candidatus Cloacimonadota bacterium]|nr:hypothetical protein [Candidatus Cloacimonadota bacterium]
SAHLFEIRFQKIDIDILTSPKRALCECPHVQRAVLPAAIVHNPEGIEQTLCKFNPFRVVLCVLYRQPHVTRAVNQIESR